MASLRRNLTANYIGRTWTALLGIALIPVYIKFMGSEAYGLVGFFATLSNVFGILDVGIASTMNRELARRSVNSELVGSQRDLVRTFEVIYWGIAISVGVIIILIAPYIANTWLKTQDINSTAALRAIQLMGIAIAFQFPGSLYQSGLIGMQKQVLVNAILIITGTFRGLGVILFLWLVSPTIQTFFAWQVVMSIVGSLVFLVAIWSNLPKAVHRARFRKDIVDDVWKYSAAIGVSALIGISLTQFDKVILSKMLSLKLFAYYSIATTVASSIWMIIFPFNIAIFPHLVQLHENNQKEEFRLQFHRSSQLLSFLLLPVSAILILFSKKILLLWIKDPLIVENAHLILSLLVFGNMLNGIVMIPASSAKAFGWPLLQTYTNLIQAIVIVPLLICMVYWLQGIGASIVWILINSTYIVIMVPLFFRRFLREEQKNWYLQDILTPVLAAFSICTFSLIIVPAMNSSYAILGWIMVTGIIAIITTGLSLPHVRNIFNQGWIKGRIKI